MNPLITKEGEYLSNYFFIKKNNNRYDLTGTQATGKKAIDSLDTFVHRKSGKYFEKKRSEVYQAAESKEISTVPFKITTKES
jgi:hypothetical protein